jgi:hypothetical protein
VQAAIQRDTLATLKGKQPAGESKMHEIGQSVRTRVAGADSLRRLTNFWLRGRLGWRSVRRRLAARHTKDIA